MKEYYFYYSKGESMMRIRATRQPGENTLPPGGTWTAQELATSHGGLTRWIVPCFPEITLGALSKLKYQGKEGVKHD